MCIIQQIIMFCSAYIGVVVIESDAERMKSAAQRLFEVKGDRMLDRLTQDDIDRIVEDEPQRLRDLPGT